MELPVTDALKKCVPRHQVRQGDGPIASALNSFVEDVTVEDCKSNGIEKSGKDANAIEMVIDEVVSSKKIKKPFSTFVASQGSVATEGRE